jgi:hypothetical protein
MFDRFLGALGWVSVRPRLFLPLGFAVIWGGVTFGLHYIPRPYEDGIHDTTLTWAGSVGLAFFVAVVGMSLTYFLSYRRSE